MAARDNGGVQRGQQHVSRVPGAGTTPGDAVRS
jgi:hypothetical protein